MVLTVDDLRAYFYTRAGVLKAVDGASFSIASGEVLGLVGESGSGKSVTGFSILGMVDPPGRVIGGRVMFGKMDLTKLREHELRRLRGNRIAIILQDPMMTLNPVLRIETQMVEAIRAHRVHVPRSEARAQARDALAKVGISAPDARLSAYPHQLSGGMRQRVAIAIALLNRPELIIADEPTTALDVTVQAQILDQVRRLCRESGTALLWITHDLSVVASLADRIAVMYAGKIVEIGPADDVLDRPLHPYTRGLLNSVPGRNRRGAPLAQIPGFAPVPLDLPAGCSFASRCDRAQPGCAAPVELMEFVPRRKVRCMNPHLEGM